MPWTMDSVENVILSSICQGIYNKFTTYSTDRYIVHTHTFFHSYESHTVLWRRGAFTRNCFDWIFVVTINADSFFVFSSEKNFIWMKNLVYDEFSCYRKKYHSFLACVYLSIFLSVDDWWAVFFICDFFLMVLFWYSLFWWIWLLRLVSLLFRAFVAIRSLLWRCRHLCRTQKNLIIKTNYENNCAANVCVCVTFGRYS